MAQPANPIPPVGKNAPGTAGRFVEVALSQVGIIEGPKDNETVFGAYTKANFQPWCGSLMMWIANEAKCTIPNTVFTPNGVAALKKLVLGQMQQRLSHCQETSFTLISHKVKQERNTLVL